jgi:hypothetical protein
MGHNLRWVDGGCRLDRAITSPRRAEDCSGYEARRGEGKGLSLHFFFPCLCTLLPGNSFPHKHLVLLPGLHLFDSTSFLLFLRRHLTCCTFGFSLCRWALMSIDVFFGNGFSGQCGSGRSKLLV